MDSNARRAGRLLERLFASVPEPVVFRLWDGTVVRTGGPGEPAFAAVLQSRQVLRRLLRNPTPLAFAEAYVDGALEVEGDLFAAMSVGQHFEGARPPIGLKLAVLAEALRP